MTRGLMVLWEWTAFRSVDLGTETTSLAWRAGGLRREWIPLGSAELGHSPVGWAECVLGTLGLDAVAHWSEALPGEWMPWRSVDLGHSPVGVLDFALGTLGVNSVAQGRGGLARE